MGEDYVSPKPTDRGVRTWYNAPVRAPSSAIAVWSLNALAPTMALLGGVAWLLGAGGKLFLVILGGALGWALKEYFG